MSKQLVVHDTTTQTLESLDPMNATGVPLPCWQVVSALPAAGQVAGEAYLVTATRTGYVWTGTNFVPIVPSALLNYPTDAALLADNTQQPGSYGTSMATGNLFISMAGGAWHAVGVRSYATEAAMKTDRNAVEGDTAWTQDTNQLWYFNAGKWFTLGVHYYATEADMIADAANAPGGGIACALDTGLMFTMPPTAGSTWQPMTIAQFATEADMRAKTTDNIAHQIAITQDQNRIYVWTGTAWIGSPVEYFATEAALLAATPPAGVLGIAGDTSKAYVKTATGWNGLAGPTMTAGIALPTTGMATGDMFYNITTKTLYVRGATTWDAVSGGATVAATAPTTPQTGQLWYDTTSKTLKTWNGTAWLVSKGGVNVVADAAHLPAVAGNKKGDMFWDADKNLPLVCEADGAAPVPLIVTSVSPGKNRLVLVDPNGRLIEHYPFPTPGASDIGKTFQIDSTQNWTLVPGVPRLAAKLAIAHHVYGANSWETTRHNISDITRYVPVGHMFKLEIVGSGVCYHGNSFETRSTIQGWGGTTSLHRAPNDPENPGGKTLYHAVSNVSAASMAPIIAIQSWTNVSNGDRSVQGYILLWDLGLPASVPDWS